jgi:SAM-dependent methyltransferase
MSSINPINLYSLDLIRTEDITYDQYKNEESITNFFWAPNQLLVNKLVEFLKFRDIKTNIIDIGCGTGTAKFPVATHLLDFNEIENGDTRIKLDLDFDKFPHINNFFDFIYCRHTLEDIQNPVNAFNEFIRISKIGYIETPSPLVEIMKGVDNIVEGVKYTGYVHHRYIVWSNLETNTLHFLPKYPIVEYVTLNDEILKKFTYLLNNFPIYWNNYYFWDINGLKPNIIIYRNGINLNINDDYSRLISEAIESSFKYTEYFVKFISAKR